MRVERSVRPDEAFNAEGTWNCVKLFVEIVLGQIVGVVQIAKARCGQAACYPRPDHLDESPVLYKPRLLSRVLQSHFLGNPIQVHFDPVTPTLRLHLDPAAFLVAGDERGGENALQGVTELAARGA